MGISFANSLQDVSHISKAWQAAENYFDWGGKTYRVTQITSNGKSKGQIEYIESKRATNFILTLLKILALPFVGLIFLGIKLAYRTKYTFKATDNTDKSKNDKTTVHTEALSKSSGSSKTSAPAPTSNKDPAADKMETIQEIIKSSPEFNGYKLSTDDSDLKDLVLTGMSLRPANFFLTLFGGCKLPGKGLFRLKLEHEEIRKNIDAAKPDNKLAITAKGKKGFAIINKKKIPVDDLTKVYGTNTYEMSYKEVSQILNSQKIYTSSRLPKQFYIALKEAMKKNKIVLLPGKDEEPTRLKDMGEARYKKMYPEIFNLLEKVKSNPKQWGFTTDGYFEKFKELTLYQIGSMVVKTEDYHLFIDNEGKIRKREAGDKDAIRLINACGIREINAKNSPKFPNLRIMTEAFKTVLTAAEKGIVIFPAVGMGVWGGDPDLYWKAFFEAVCENGDKLDAIIVNPNHQKTAKESSEKYPEQNGGEFKGILNLYIEKATKEVNSKHLKNLKKIINVRDLKTDVIQLAHNLKVAFPDEIVSLLNASDPDVTLGYHVGEYVNNIPHTFTTEENYTAMGTNGLCFEGITRVHSDPKRIIQC